MDLQCIWTWLTFSPGTDDFQPQTLSRYLFDGLGHLRKHHRKGQALLAPSRLSCSACFWCTRGNVPRPRHPSRTSRKSTSENFQNDIRSTCFALLGAGPDRHQSVSPPQSILCPQSVRHSTLHQSKEYPPRGSRLTQKLNVRSHRQSREVTSFNY